VKKKESFKTYQLRAIEWFAKEHGYRLHLSIFPDASYVDKQSGEVYTHNIHTIERAYLEAKPWLRAPRKRKQKNETIPMFELD
jgi:hypothetical protein